MIENEINLVQEFLSILLDFTFRDIFFISLGITFSGLLISGLRYIFRDISFQKLDDEKPRYDNCIHPDNSPEKGACERCMYGYENYINETETVWCCLMDNLNNSTYDD